MPHGSSAHSNAPRQTTRRPGSAHRKPQSRAPPVYRNGSDSANSSPWRSKSPQEAASEGHIIGEKLDDCLTTEKPAVSAGEQEAPILQAAWPVRPPRRAATLVVKPVAANRKRKKRNHAPAASARAMELRAARGRQGRPAEMLIGARGQPHGAGKLATASVWRVPRSSSPLFFQRIIATVTQNPMNLSTIENGLDEFGVCRRS